MEYFRMTLSVPSYSIIILQDPRKTKLYIYADDMIEVETGAPISLQ
jgi:hypothetical protein